MESNMHPEVKNLEPDYLYDGLRGQYPVTLAFDALLLSFTKRNLTYQADTLRAVGGLIRQIESPFFQGLPTATFDLFTLFAGHFRHLRRRECFPSYSWPGWIGRVRFEMRGLLTEPELIAPWLSSHT